MNVVDNSSPQVRYALLLHSIAPSANIMPTCIHVRSLVFGVFGGFITPAFSFILS